MTATLVRIALEPGADLDGFRDAVRRLIAEDAPPERVVFDAGPSRDLFGVAPASTVGPLMLPKAAGDMIRLVACHSDPERYALLYRMIWRQTHGEKALLEVSSDPLVHRLERMAKSVRRDLHKMHAFVRFRRIGEGEAERYVAWFEPEHFIVEATAGFFVDRFRSMDWAILTPKGSLHWDRKALTIGPAAAKDAAPDHDGFETHWLDYYESIFNPARVNPDVMRGEMPVKYWRNLPEAQLIPRMIQEAPQRVQAMIEREASTPMKRNPEKAVAAMADQTPKSLDALNRIIAASEPPAPFSPKAVLGEGPIGAAIAFVGEQPGDQEDLEGRPFIGPAGQVLGRAMAEAGIERSDSYVTNAVKHFKFKPSGKRRLHQSPTAGEVKHYRWWLERELEFVRPKVVVALGATATLALEGKPLPITKSRGPHPFPGWSGVITVHPSYLLRLPDAEEKHAAYAAFIADLREAARMAVAA